MTNSSDEVNELLSALPAELRLKFVQLALEQRAGLRKLDQKYFALVNESEKPAGVLALILEHALARFDFVAHVLLTLSWYIPNPNALEASPVFQQQLEGLVKAALEVVRPSLHTLGEDRAADVTAELILKLRAKQQGCLAILELGQATRGASPDFESFSRQIEQSPMRSRAHWWDGTSSADFDEMLKEAIAALERSKLVIASVTERSQIESPQAESFDWISALSTTGDEMTRKDTIDLFLKQCSSQLPFRVTRTHIWKSVGHTHPRQFQYWQKSSPKATTADDENFRRILGMTPRKFEALLKKKKVIEEKS